MRVILLVLDSVGIGAAPDAAAYGDEGANTLGNMAHAVGSLRLPTFERLGLGNIPPLIPGGRPIVGVTTCPAHIASFGAMQPVSRGKDTTSGHWEIAGLFLETPFHLFPAGPPSFPPALVRDFERRTGRKMIGNKAASGTAIIAELGQRQLREGCWIVYTSADSVMQIAAHEGVIPLDELYHACEVARELCDPLRVGRVIARPFVGEPGKFIRTSNRRDYSLVPPRPTIMDRLAECGIPSTSIGKVDDIFAQRGFARRMHSETTKDAQGELMQFLEGGGQGLAFVNFIDFDMQYGHRRDPHGYAGALRQADEFVGGMLRLLGEEDMLIITADHGNDPTFRGTDHTREFVPLLVLRPGRGYTRNLGIRHGYYDIAQSVAAFFAAPPMPLGRSFL